ncbi:hypothetical protein B0F90DRAFT_1404455 [Multifurca ochricompacta]|uniref:F-box domain-containing protein n=1 Tax=Multifurca ochricompacta TaxID=376703 RepID=A0AAD4LWU3_9AGAM|nr:hypothetical protein B0F90DRAFT_1404455 [Multifurca ochricompacta]
MGDLYHNSERREQQIKRLQHGGPGGRLTPVRGPITIDTLPDDVLLEIFVFYRLDLTTVTTHWDLHWKWHRLAHVCHKWRQLIFASPRRLNLQLICKPGTPVRRNLDCWPALPVVIDFRGSPSSGFLYKVLGSDEDNIVAALEHPGRVCGIYLDVTSSLLRKMDAVMQGPFMALTSLLLSSKDRIVPVLSDEFLGGFAPGLLHLSLKGISFPALPKLLLSTSALSSLRLESIPITGYISPEVTVACLSALPNLKTFSIKFLSLTLPDRRSRRPPPQTRVVLPALTEFSFHGLSQYLEDLVVRIDAPLLCQLKITFFHQLVFNIPQITQFVNRTDRLRSLSRAHIKFWPCGLGVSTFIRSMDKGINRWISWLILCSPIDWQVSSMTQIFQQSLPLHSNIEELVIDTTSAPQGWQDDIGAIEWLDLFHPFSAVERLHVAGELGTQVARSLEEGSRDPTMETFPKLRTLTFWSPPKLTSVEQFITARELSGNPVIVSYSSKSWTQWFKFD